MALAGGVLALAGCSTPIPDRGGETLRFRDEMQKRVAELKIDAAVPLTADRCVGIALRNSLDQRVRELRAGLQDAKVRQSLADALPKVNLAVSDSRRDKPPMMDLFGSPIAMEDQETRYASLQAVVPVLDWGATYYAWRIAKDRRQQELLMVERARQQLNRDVRVAHARLAGAQRQEKMARIAVLAAQEMVRIARSVEREGLDSHASTAAVEAGQAQVVQVWTGLRRNVELSRMRLSQVMSLPAGIAFTVADQMPEVRPLPDPATLPQFADRALAFRPEMRIQDRERHAAHAGVKKAVADFLPNLNFTGSYNWTSASRLVDSTYFSWGTQLSQSLLNGGRNWNNLSMAKQTRTVEEEQTLLLSMGILYEVDYSILQLLSAHDAKTARKTVAQSRFEEMKMIASRYRQGLETGGEAARGLANLYMAYLDLDRDETDYQVAWLDLEKAAPLAAATATGDKDPAVPVPLAPLPAYQPAPAIKPFAEIPEAFPGIDISQYPEIEQLIRNSGVNGILPEMKK
jgi:outer membrane protein TolC